MLDARLLRRSIAEETSALIDDLELFPSIASTNTYLLAKTPPTPGRIHVALADHQTSGRGRHSRRWLSAPGSALCLSLAYTFARRPGELPALTLATGVAVLDALGDTGIDNIRLKWPNDIVANDRKLGGVLTELRSGTDPEVTVVTGIGVNFQRNEQLAGTIDPSWAREPIALADLDANPPPREVLAASIISRLAATIRVFAGEGFAPFAEAWHAADWLAGRQVVVDGPKGAVAGTARGVDATGALKIDTGSGQLRIVSGSVALASAAA